MTTKAKLTKVQQKVMDRIETAFYLYKYQERSVMHAYFENGKQPGYKVENGVWLDLESAYIVSADTVKVEAKKETLLALEKKSYVKSVEILPNQNFDNVTLFENTFAKPHTELTEIVFIVNEHKSKYARAQGIYCPVGQEEQTIMAYKDFLEQCNQTTCETFRLLETNIVKCDHWK